VLEAGHWKVPLVLPLSRQPDSQHRAEQQSLAAQASPLHMCPSCWLRAICPAAHSCDPLESPLSRQPDIQHRAEQQSLAEQPSPLHVCQSSWPRAICPDGHRIVPSSTAAVESRKPVAQHGALGDDDSAKATSGSIFSLPVACPLTFFSRRTFHFRRNSGLVLVTCFYRF